ncbi:MAG: site-specific DNA-methyltransferase [Flavobacteriales bacterium]|nr:site-specific DNA-methyltransferase [Flavobacteriales bacterium]
MAHTKLRPSFTFNEDQLAALKGIAPEAFADGQVNWETLRAALGEHLEDDDADAEHFGLNWPGKREARRMAGTPSKGTLVPQTGKGVNEDTTRNVFIEGENLEVLKLLQKAYAGKVKMIYIDPPYNTGNDFVYEDDFTEPLEEYLRRTGQVDDEGRKLTTNTRADGRFHSKWLSMMYPRLRLARQLLRDDGVIFVSIDDNEVHHLRNLMSEVYGDESFLGQLVWLKKRKGSFLTKGIISTTEYCVVHSKTIEGKKLYGGRADESESQPLVKRTNSVGTLSIEAGLVQTKLKPKTYPKGRYGTGSSGIDLLDDVVVKDGVITSAFRIKGPFIWSQSYLDDYLSKGAQLIVNTENFQLRVFKPQSADSFKGLPSFINGLDIEGTNEDAYEQLRDLFGEEGVFDYSKPVNYVKHLIGAATEFDKEAIVLDFFAGSGTTAQAVEELNASDGGNRKFLLVQLPEVLEEDHKGRNHGFETIADITRERLKRAFTKNKSDAGFLSFGLEKSNFRAWSDVEGADLTALEKAFAEAESPLVKDWTREGLRTEVMLLEGFPLDSRVEQVKQLQKNVVDRISHEWHSHHLLVCLDKKVHADTIQGLELGDGDIFICLDTAIDDQSKLRLSDKGMIKTI